MHANKGDVTHITDFSIIMIKNVTWLDLDNTNINYTLLIPWEQFSRKKSAFQPQHRKCMEYLCMRLCMYDAIDGNDPYKRLTIGH